MKRIMLGMFVCGGMALAQDKRSTTEQKNPFAGQTAAIEAGQKLFREGCAACHGANAEGGRGPNLADNQDLKGMSDERLFNTIRKGIRGTDMPASPLSDERTWQVAAFVRSLSTPAFEADVKGDLSAGDAIFHGKGNCGSCHMIRGAGGFIGPDLTNIGALDTVSQIREGIVRPDVRRAPGFQGVTVVAKDGQRIEGIAKNYSNYAIQLLDQNGKLHLLDRADLTNVNLAEKTLMPENYGQKLTSDELQNLIVYLSKQVIRPDAKSSDRQQRAEQN